MAGSFERGNEIQLCKMSGISGLTDQLSASQQSLLHTVI